MDTRIWLDHVRFHRTRSEGLRASLVAEHLGYAKHLAGRFVRSSDLREDLEQVALEALLVALDRFDPARGTPFLGFAAPTITGALKRYHRDAGWALRVPRRVHELAPAIRRAGDLLLQDLGREPTDAEVADLLGVSEVDVAETLRASDARNLRSLDLDAASGFERGVADPAFGQVEDRAAVQQAMASLAGTSREVLGLYFEDGLSQATIAARLGVSQMQISRILRQALAQLRSRVPA